MDKTLARLSRRFGRIESRHRIFAGRPGTEYTLGPWGEFWIADGLPAETVLELLEGVLLDEHRGAYGDRRSDAPREVSLGPPSTES